MNPIYYNSANKCTVVESCYYPDPKEIKPVPVEHTKDEVMIEEVVEELPKKDNVGRKKEVQFNEENIVETQTPLFSNYFLDQNEADPNFFRKKVQSYYHENIPEQEMESIFENEISASTPEKEKLIKDFRKAKERYEEALRKIQLAGIDEEERSINFEYNELENPSLPELTPRKCDVTAKQSTYVGMPDMHHYFS